MRILNGRTKLKAIILVFTIMVCTELFGATRLIEQSIFIQGRFAFRNYYDYNQGEFVVDRAVRGNLSRTNLDYKNESELNGTLQLKSSSNSLSSDAPRLSQVSTDNHVRAHKKKSHKTIATALEHLKLFPFQVPPRSNRTILNPMVFRKAQKCLLNSSYVPSGNVSLLGNFNDPLPKDLEDHYMEIMNLTAPLRNVSIKTYLGYSGPWLENAFINEFCCDKPLSFFGGLVPLFVQWTDLWHLHKERWHTLPMGKQLFSALRKDVIYLAVSQHADGIYHGSQYIRPDDNWNVLIFSGGGYGHAPIPLFMHEQRYEAFNQTAIQYLFVFAGTGRTKYVVRKKMTEVLKNLSNSDPSISVKFYNGDLWQKVMRSGSLNLAPRGYGRASFRIVEAIQMGLIPVYLYDDYDWSPYKGTPAHVSNFGYALNISNFDTFVQQIAIERNKNPARFLAMLEEKHAKLLRFRDSHYTMSGLMKQIRYFVQNDSRSSIGCQEFPRRPILYSNSSNNDP